ncbi:MAG: ROK family transcriptional regulator [Pseudomonadota bacterium]|nr:ROK family transcriptional regulator [Pseudomonadota bacterium]
MTQPVQAALLRQLNTLHVLGVIRRQGPISRVQIVDATGLSKAAVSNITGALLAGGLLVETAAEGNGEAERGRPRVMLELNPRAAFLVGVSLSSINVGVAVINFRGQVVDSIDNMMRPYRHSPEVVADMVKDGIQQCAAQAGLSLDQIEAVGIGIPGLVEQDGGIVHWPSIFSRSDVPFKALIASRLRRPVFIDNDVNLYTLAQHWKGVASNLDDFALVYVDLGIGLGLVLHGELYRGSAGLGTELGHIQIDRNGPLCGCGQRGCLNAFASDVAILNRAAGIIDICDPDDPFAARRAIQQVTEQARAGNEPLQAVFREAGEALGIGLADLINLINPPVIVLCGGGLRAGGLLLDPMKAAMQANVLPALEGRTRLILDCPPIQVRGLGPALYALQQRYFALPATFRAAT